MSSIMAFTAPSTTEPRKSDYVHSWNRRQGKIYSLLLRSNYSHMSPLTRCRHFCLHKQPHILNKLTDTKTHRQQLILEHLLLDVRVTSLCEKKVTSGSVDVTIFIYRCEKIYFICDMYFWFWYLLPPATTLKFNCDNMTTLMFSCDNIYFMLWNLLMVLIFTSNCNNIKVYLWQY